MVLHLQGLSGLRLLGGSKWCDLLDNEPLGVLAFLPWRQSRVTDGAWFRAGRSTANTSDALLIHQHFSRGFHASLFCHLPIQQTEVPAEAQAL